MARIRTVKPEFITDGKIQRLSDSCALFFIVLWNFCDDEGKHRLDYDQLVAELGGRWRKDKVSLFVSCLVKSGQLRISSDSDWIQVTGWSHQKIDRPKQPKVKASELHWLTVEDSTNVRGLIANDRRKERIGEERIGKDRMGSSEPAEAGLDPRKNPPEKLLKKNEEKTPPGVTIATWENYSMAYAKRYGTPPVRNATVNGMLARFVKRLPADEAPFVAEFYLSHNNSFYVQRCHPVELLLKDAEKLRTEWATNRKVTALQARQQESADHYQSQLERLARGEL